MKEKTIKEVSDLWRRDKKQYVKVSTYAAYVLILENHILPAFGNRTTISESEVQEFIIASLNDGLAQKTVRDMLIDNIRQSSTKFDKIGHYSLLHSCFLCVIIDTADAENIQEV